MNKISVVVPCFNEEEVLSVFYKKTSEVLNEIEGITYELLFVDDVDKSKLSKHVILLLIILSV